MREPAFWHAPSSWLARLLMPLAAVYGAIAAGRMTRKGIDLGIPLLCVGNYHTGGAGKTPTALALVALLRDLGETPVVLSRGYGGSLRGPLRVEPGRHSAAEVGDEPLMMAQHVPVVIARDRVDGASMARSTGATVMVMDDGFQNPALNKDANFIVIDGDRGLGNGRVLPAGPLRAPLDAQIARTNALIIVGDGAAADGVAAAIAAQGGPVWRAKITPDAGIVAELRQTPVLAFAGIGDPARFFRTLTACGIHVAAQKIFPDHHPYTQSEIDALSAQAERDGLAMVTTEKDLVRLRSLRTPPGVRPLTVSLTFEDHAALRTYIQERLTLARSGKFRT